MDLTPYAKVIDVLTKRVEELESVRNSDVAQLIYLATLGLLL